MNIHKTDNPGVNIKFWRLSSSKSGRRRDLSTKHQYWLLTFEFCQIHKSALKCHRNWRWTFLIHPNYHDICSAPVSRSSLTLHCIWLDDHFHNLVSHHSLTTSTLFIKMVLFKNILSCCSVLFWCNLSWLAVAGFPKVKCYWVTAHWLCSVL